MSIPYGYYDFSDDGSYASGPDEPRSGHTPEEILQHYWGYDSFRPMQREIVESVLAGRDTLGLLPTGGGKSITFQVPALMLPGLTIVVTPLISLMKDQVDGLRRRGIGAAYLHSGMSRSETNYALERCRTGRVKLLYVSPERAASERFLGIVSHLDISFIVIDEAHCISQWGYDFRPSYLKLTALRKAFATAPLLALTASATPEVAADIIARLEMVRPDRHMLSFSRPNISFLVRRTQDKFGKLLEILRATTGSAIVYTRSRRRTADLAAQLRQSGIDALYYHAGLESHEKAEHQDAWQTGSSRVMVATTAFGMGIDKPDVRLVVHYDPPTTLEEFYQEAGRAGRDGKESVGVLLASSHDKATLARRISSAFPSKEQIRYVYDEICRYLAIPMGEGFGAIYDFSPAKMCAKYQLNGELVMGCIYILDRAGYFDFIEEMDIETQVMIRMRRDDLYSHRFEAAEEALMNQLLRTYPGLFADMVSISEQYLSQETGIRIDMVHEILKEWRRHGIISYVPHRGTAQIFVSANRVPSERLIFPKEVYDDRLEAMQRQVKAMTDFIYDQDSCRVAGMLRYFGETDPAECGKCDVCRSKRSVPHPFDTEAFEQRLPEFFVMIAPAKWLDTRSLKAYYPHNYSEVCSHLAAMIDNGRLIAQGALISLPDSPPKD